MKAMQHLKTMKEALCFFPLSPFIQFNAGMI